MKIIGYIFRNVFRNKLRSLLTVMAIWICMALMTFLYGFLAGQKAWQKAAQRYNRIVVLNIQGFTAPLTYRMLDDVRRMNGVEAATSYSWFGGLYLDEPFSFAQFGVDPETVFDVWNEFKIPPDQLAAFKDKSNRQACVCDRKLAEKYGWKVGEHIRLKGAIYPVNLDLTLVGIFDPPEEVLSLWYNLDYLDKQLEEQDIEMRGNVGIIYARAKSVEIIPELMRSIDEHFSNSELPTKTQNEGNFAQMFVKMLGNVQNFILFIGVFVTLSLTLVAANGMAMSMRERTTEIAVLKAIGFRNDAVLTMLLGEAVVIAVIGGILGVLLGRWMYSVAHTMATQFFPTSHMPWPVMVYGLLVAAGIGLASGFVPAMLAARLSVIDGLRKVV
jgi:putative ABC transport system permease protein